MGTKKTSEMSVEEAATHLAVTPRSVINYIKAREIEAIKVGKAWHINLASLDAFKQRYGFESNHSETITTNTENAEKKKDTAQTFRKSNGVQKEKRDIYPVSSLRLFQIAKEVLHNVAITSLFPANRPDLEQKFFSPMIRSHF